MTRWPDERVAAGVKVLLMQQTAKILKFKGETLKTLKDEARQIHIQLAGMLKRFVDGKIEAKEKPSRIIRGIRLKLPM